MRYFRYPLEVALRGRCQNQEIGSRLQTANTGVIDVIKTSNWIGDNAWTGSKKIGTLNLHVHMLPEER